MPLSGVVAEFTHTPGHIKDEVVLIGCHRDAWVMGAADPTSGTVSLREIVRGFGYLLRNGWKPLRTVLFVSWDAEEVRVAAVHLIYLADNILNSTASLAPPSGAKTSGTGFRSTS